jgi:hypothetical protein
MHEMQRELLDAQRDTGDAKASLQSTEQELGAVREANRQVFA